MSQFRGKVIESIRNTLGKSTFGTSNFEISSPNDGVTLSVITFKPRDEFRFVINTPHDGHGFNLIYVPGIVMSEEATHIDKFDSVHLHLIQWGARINEELKSMHPIYDDFEELKKTFEDNLNENIENEYITFNNSEIEDLKEKIDDLYNKFEKQDILEDELERIKKELESMKDDLSNYTKKMWYKIAGNKFFDICGRLLLTKEGIQFAKTAVTGLLGMDDIQIPE